MFSAQNPSNKNTVAVSKARWKKQVTCKETLSNQSH
jgi:hypothetical protein